MNSLKPLKLLSLGVLASLTITEAKAVNITDINTDCYVNHSDVALFIDRYDSGDERADIDNDGNLSSSDIKSFISSFQQNQGQNVCGNVSLEPCPGFEDEHIYPVMNYEMDAICPSPQTEIIYVSDSGTGDGSSPSNTLSDPAEAVSRLEDGTQAWVVLERGSVFFDSKLGTMDSKSGVDVNHPLVISAYGDQLDKRPKLITRGITAVSIREGENIVLSDIHLEATPGVGGTGVSLFANSFNPLGLENVVIQNMYVRGYNNSINVQSTSPNFRMKNILIIDSIFADSTSAPGPGGHSQGLFATNYEGLKIINNVFDHSGWYKDRDEGGESETIQCWLLDQHVAATFPADQDPQNDGYMENKRYSFNRDWIDNPDPNRFGENHPYRDIDFSVLDPNTLERVYNNDGVHTKYKVDITQYREFLLEEPHYIEHCPDGFTKLYRDGAATVFNHAMYLQKGAAPPEIIENNIVMRASASGIQARSGAEALQNNVFSRNPDGFFIGGYARDEEYGESSFVYNNFVSETVRVNSSSGGMAFIRHKTAPDAKYISNILSNAHPITDGNAIGFTLRCSSDNDYGSADEREYTSCKADFSENILYNTNTREGSNSIRFSGNLHDLEGQNVISDNIIHGSPNGYFARWHGSIAQAYNLLFQDEKYIFDGNTYVTDSIKNNNRLFRLDDSSGNFYYGFTEWKNDVEENAKGKPNREYVDPCRTLATYYDDVILGNINNDNCTIMHDDDLFEAMAQELRKNNRLSPQNEYSTENIINYIRAGFNVKDEGGSPLQRNNNQDDDYARTPNSNNTPPRAVAKVPAQSRRSSLMKEKARSAQPKGVME